MKQEKRQSRKNKQKKQTPHGQSEGGREEERKKIWRKKRKKKENERAKNPSIVGSPQTTCVLDQQSPRRCWTAQCVCSPFWTRGDSRRPPYHVEVESIVGAFFLLGLRRI